MLTADAQHLIARQSCSVMPFAARPRFGVGTRGVVDSNWIAPLSVTVMSVVGGRSQKQMGRIDASRGIAFVADVKTITDGTIDQFVSNSVYERSDSFVEHDAVSAVVGFWTPKQASFDAFSNSPNAVFDGQSAASESLVHEAHSTTVVCSP
jgi:hypothetical protein